MEAADVLRERNRELEDEVRELRKKNEAYDTDNKTQRDELREARSEIEALKKQVPAEGSTVLKNADAERWQQYQELGKVDEVKAALSAKSTAEQELARVKRREIIREAGYKPTMLERLLNGAPLKADGEGDDRTYSVATKDAEGNENFIPLEDWANTEGISDLLSVARLEPQGTTPFVLDQVGRRTPLPPTDVSRAERDKAFS